MSEQDKNQERDPVSEAWYEVGLHFRALGNSLASAFHATWHSPETRQHLEEVQESLETMVDEIGRAVKEASTSEEAKKVQAEVEKAAQSAKSTGYESMEEIRPQLLSAFRKVRVELDQVIAKMEAKEQAQSASDTDAPASETDE